MMARSQTLQSEAGYIDARPHSPDRRNPLATHGRTVHSGQSRRFLDVRATSAHAPRAATKRTCQAFAFVPTTDTDIYVAPTLCLLVAPRQPVAGPCPASYPH